MQSEDELIRRVQADLIDSYDEELELELDDRLVDAMGDASHAAERRREGSPAPLFPRALSPAGRAGQAAGLGGRHAAQGRDHLRGTRRCRQGRRHQAHHAAAQPAYLPRRRAAGTERPRAHAVVFPALRGAPAGGRRDRSLRSQLVQPRRRRAGDGLLRRRRSTRSSSAPCPSSRRCWCARASSSSSTGSRSPTRSSTCASSAASTIRSSSGS